MTDDYRCPGCGTSDRTRYYRCNVPECPDGRDQTRRAPDEEAEYEHNGHYARSQTFDPYASPPDRETWAAWFGRRTADAVFFLGAYYALRWLGVIVVVNVCGVR